MIGKLSKPTPAIEVPTAAMANKTHQFRILLREHVSVKIPAGPASTIWLNPEMDSAQPTAVLEFPAIMKRYVSKSPNCAMDENTEKMPLNQMIFQIFFCNCSSVGLSAPLPIAAVSPVWIAIFLKCTVIYRPESCVNDFGVIHTFILFHAPPNVHVNCPCNAIF